jgi:hypothetical protein
LSFYPSLELFVQPLDCICNRYEVCGVPSTVAKPAS